MNYNEKSKEWYNRALKEKDEFVKFILLFIALEVSTKTKSSKIIDISQDDSIRTKFYERINHNYLEELKSNLDKNPHKNMQNPNDRRWDGKLKSAENFEGIIRFVTWARNNLFHGDKGLDEERDLFIVNYGNKILQPLVEAIIL